MKVSTVLLTNFNITVDVYNSERVPMKSPDDNCKYYITPKKLASLESWYLSNVKSGKITSRRDLAFIISQGWIAEYGNRT